MEIRLNKSIDRWLDLSNGKKELEIKIDHLTREQYYKLEQIILSCNDLPYVVDKEKGTAGFDFARMSAEQKAKALTYNRKYMEYYLKYTIKAWRGVKENGVEVPLSLINNEMEDSYWTGFLAKLTYEEIEKIFQMIESEVNFGITDLKK